MISEISCLLVNEVEQRRPAGTEDGDGAGYEVGVGIGMGLEMGMGVEMGVEMRLPLPVYINPCGRLSPQALWIRPRLFEGSVVGCLRCN